MLNRRALTQISALLLLSTICSLPAFAAAPKVDESTLVHEASDEGQSAIDRFKIAPGFKVTLFAAEPHLANPVAICTDEKGRWYVAETFRLHAGVTDIRGHMDWLNEELASQTVTERDAYMTKHEGKRIADYYTHTDRV